jgi:hypothetical protein
MARRLLLSAAVVVAQRVSSEARTAALAVAVQAIPSPTATLAAPAKLVKGTMVALVLDLPFQTGSAMELAAAAPVARAKVPPTATAVTAATA